MEGALSVPLPVRLLLLVALPAAGWLTSSTPRPPSTAPQDGIRINVTTLRDNGEASKEQVVLNITYENGQVYVNDLPVNSGVTRISCQTLIVGSVTSLQTTSHYLMGSVETAVEGNALPGKLPETPLRAEPPSSYKVMCQWMEKLRRALCHLWGSVFPVLFMFLNVMLVGVLGAAGVIAMLKVLCPAYENKGILQVDEMNALSVVPIILYPDGSEKTEEKLKDKTSI